MDREKGWGKAGERLGELDFLLTSQGQGGTAWLKYNNTTTDAKTKDNSRLTA
jgi:hypothetical protein